MIARLATEGLIYLGRIDTVEADAKAADDGGVAIDNTNGADGCVDAALLACEAVLGGPERMSLERNRGRVASGRCDPCLEATFAWDTCTAGGVSNSDTMPPTRHTTVTNAPTAVAKGEWGFTGIVLNEQEDYFSQRGPERAPCRARRPGC